PRLGQWDGRRRSSRSDQLTLPELWQGPVMLRLGAVFFTIVAATLFAFFWGPPMPYRAGEVCPNDLRARVFFKVVNQPKTSRAREDAVGNLPEESRKNPEECEKVRALTEVIYDSYQGGSPIVLHGQPITEQQISLLDEEHRAYQRSLGRLD